MLTKLLSERSNTIRKQTTVFVKEPRSWSKALRQGFGEMLTKPGGLIAIGIGAAFGAVPFSIFSALAPVPWLGPVISGALVLVAFGLSNASGLRDETE